MATYAVAEDAVAVHDKTLVASTVDTVTFHDTPRAVAIISDGADEIYFTVDGTAPTVGGANTYKIPALPAQRVINAVSGQPVKLISAGTPTYDVEVA